MKRIPVEEIMKNCRLCPRNCGADRTKAKGYCLSGSRVEVARAALHFWEEPCISGKAGAGAVFFCGCALDCVFCQNRQISRGKNGVFLSRDELVRVFLSLQAQGANNINLVTGDHFIPQLADALGAAKQAGLVIPVVFNCSGYEKVSSLQLLEGLVDVYLPDMKYYSSALSEKYAHAPDYFSVAKEALAEMVRQTGPPQFAAEGEVVEAGILKKGTLVRHLVLPGAKKDSKKIIKYLYNTYKDAILISVLNQYTPMEGVRGAFPELGRPLSKREYNEVISFALGLGLENGYVQEDETAGACFIPDFEEKAFLQMLSDCKEDEINGGLE